MRGTSSSWGQCHSAPLVIEPKAYQAKARGVTGRQVNWPRRTNKLLLNRHGLLPLCTAKVHQDDSDASYCFHWRTIAHIDVPLLARWNCLLSRLPLEAKASDQSVIRRHHGQHDDAHSDKRHTGWVAVEDLRPEIPNGLSCAPMFLQGADKPIAADDQRREAEH